MSEFDQAHRIVVSYIDRSREYYLAKGHGNPYRWASHEDAPFTPLAKPLSQSRVALFTTASRNEDWKKREVYAAPTSPAPGALFTDHLFWHKKATHTNDVESFLPIRRLEKYATLGRIGNLASQFYGVPTDYSIRRTVDEIAPAALERCHADEVDIALLVAL